jgi:hypothetical protein
MKRLVIQARGPGGSCPAESPLIHTCYSEHCKGQCHDLGDHESLFEKVFYTCNTQVTCNHIFIYFCVSLHPWKNVNVSSFINSVKVHT